jgi:hypothetical protein
MDMNLIPGRAKVCDRFRRILWRILWQKRLPPLKNNRIESRTEVRKGLASPDPFLHWLPWQTKTKMQLALHFTYFNPFAFAPAAAVSTLPD